MPAGHVRYTTSTAVETVVQSINGLRVRRIASSGIGRVAIAAKAVQLSYICTSRRGGRASKRLCTVILTADVRVPAGYIHL